MRTMFGKTTTSTSTSKASSCQNASFNNAQVMSLSTILVVLILMVLINMIIPILLIGIIGLIIRELKCKSKPEFVTSYQAYNLDYDGFAHNTAKPFFISTTERRTKMKKNVLKKAFAVAMSVMMVGAFMTGCGGGGDDASVVVIGGSGPLTGDYSTYGISVKQGAQLAVDEINAAGGVNGVEFKLVFEDDVADPVTATQAYAKMADEGMQLSLGGTTSGACLAAATEAEKDGVLMITPSASQVECCAPANAFRVCFTDPLQGEFAAQTIKDEALGTKVAVIYDKSNDYSAGIQKAFQAKADAIGLNVVETQAFTSSSNTDFSVQLNAVKSSGADLVFLPIYAQEAAYVLTQAEKMGLDVQFLGGDGLDGVIPQLGDNAALAEGVMLLTPFAADAADDATQAFVAAYQAKHGEIPNQFAADAYDAIYVIKAAIEKAGITDANISAADLCEAMKAAMVEIEVPGLTGTMTWTADGEPSKTPKAMVIADGAYKAM